MHIGRGICAVMLLAIVACHSPRTRPVVPAAGVANEAAPLAPPQNTDLDSREILARTTVSSPVLVKHVLFGWAALADAYRGGLDPRAAKRDRAGAAKLAEEVAAELRANPGSIDALMEQHSEDPGSLTKKPYTIETDSAFVPEFKNLGQRLEVNEVGIVMTMFGYHVMIRVAPPPRDPLESADILARPALAGPVDVQHILISWEGLDATQDELSRTRSKAEADTLASEVLRKVRAGDDMAALMKQYSEDQGSSDTGKHYTVEAESRMFEPFKQLSFRLAIGEAGLVKTTLGWHVIKRVPPPPPDSLESTKILKRTTVAARVKVKHILLGWKAVHTEDPRGATRSRPELEKLVKATVARLAKRGADIDELMAKLSEDPGSAKTGEAYEVTPTAGLVKPFLDLSLRLELNEVGVVKTDFGMHIIKRVE